MINDFKNRVGNPDSHRHISDQDKQDRLLIIDAIENILANKIHLDKDRHGYEMVLDHLKDNNIYLATKAWENMETGGRDYINDLVFGKMEYDDYGFEIGMTKGNPKLKDALTRQFGIKWLKENNSKYSSVGEISKNLGKFFK